MNSLTTIVNLNAPTDDFEPVNLLRRVDFPTLGNPIKTTVASPVLLTSNPSDFFALFLVWMASCSLFSFAIFAFSRPIWCSVALLSWVLPISS